MKRVVILLLATLTQGFSQTKTVGPNGEGVNAAAFKASLNLAGSYVALSGNQTAAGNKTFSGQMELTGQAATNSSSAMTRSLGDARYTRFTNLARTTTTTTTTQAATLADITGLSVTIAETGIYHLVGCCTVTPANSSMGAKIALAFPSGSGTCSGTDQSSNNGQVTGSFSYNATTFASLASGVVRQVVGGANSASFTVRFDLLLNVTSAPAVVKYQFMQHTSDGGTLTANIGSHIIVEKIQ